MSFICAQVAHVCVIVWVFFCYIVIVQVEWWVSVCVCVCSCSCISTNNWILEINNNFFFVSNVHSIHNWSQLGGGTNFKIIKFFFAVVCVFVRMDSVSCAVLCLCFDKTPRAIRKWPWECIAQTVKYEKKWSWQSGRSLSMHHMRMKDTHTIT